MSRLASISDERAAIEAEMGRDEVIVVPDGWLVEVAESFASWGSLRSDERRELLAGFRVELVVERPARGAVRIDRVRLAGLPSGVWLFNYMPR